MNAPRLTLSRRGIHGALLLALAAAVMAAAAWLPWLWYENLRGRADAAATELKFIAARIDASKVASRAVLTAADDVTPLFVAGDTPGLAQANLQAKLAAAGAATGVTVVRSQPLQGDRTAELAVLRDEVEVTGAIANLRDFLLAVETGEPLLFVTQAEISVPATAAAESGALPSEKLNATLQVEAYGWWEAAP